MNSKCDSPILLIPSPWNCERKFVFVWLKWKEGFWDWNKVLNSLNWLEDSLWNYGRIKKNRILESTQNNIIRSCWVFLTQFVKISLQSIVLLKYTNDFILQSKKPLWPSDISIFTSHSIIFWNCFNASRLLGLREKCANKNTLVFRIFLQFQWCFVKIMTLGLISLHSYNEMNFL
jgi:hypothetical protein